MERLAIGSDMVRNILNGEAPSVRAACSSLTGTASNPSLAEFMRNGREIKAMANPMAKGEPMRFRPMLSANFPRRESRDMRPSIAIPAAEWGSTMGRSMNPWRSVFPRNSFLARR